MADPVAIDEAAPTVASGPPEGATAEEQGPSSSRGGSPRGSGSGPTGGTAFPTQTLTPAETLRLDEVMRMRKFLQVGVVLGVVAFVLTLFLHGDPLLEQMLHLGIGITISAFVGFYAYIRDDARYSQRKGLGIAAIGIAAATIGVHYFGLLSPAPMILLLGIYFFSLGSSVGASLLGYLLSAVPQALGMAAIAFGVMRDRGLLSPPALSVASQMMVIVMVQVVLAATFVFARMSRRATLSAVASLERALRQVSQREALLQEAHQDLEKVLRGGRPAAPGNRVGPWMLSHVIGRGAMGEVYEARHVERDLPAALKILHADSLVEPERVRRFLREAEITSRLESPNIVRVYEVSDGTRAPPYLAMELLQGSDLAAVLRRARRMPARRTVELVEQVANALEKARGADVVHRDIKPSNLFFAEDQAGRVWKVLDFGVSRLASSQGTLTQGQVVGTPGYMSPEQAQGTHVDHRADVFSLAAIAYRCLTGRPPFSGEGSLKVMFDTVYGQPPRPGSLVNLPPDVDLALALGLAKLPDDRPSRAVDFAVELRLAVEGRLPEELRARARDLLARAPWTD